MSDLKAWLITSSDNGRSAKILAQCDTELEAMNHQVGGFVMSRRQYNDDRKQTPGPKKTLKMYVWEGVLTDYTSGLIVVMAYSKQHAIDVARRNRDCGANVVREMTIVKPKVYRGPHMAYVHGGG